MKLLEIVPINSEITQEEKDYIAAPLHGQACDPTEITFERLFRGKPSIESAYDEVINTGHVYAILEEKAGEGYAACYIDCFGDPGVSAARCRADFPVFGGFEPAVLIALGLADRIGIITIVDNVQPMLHEHIHMAHLERRIVSVRNVDIPVLELTDHSLLIRHLTEQAKAAVTEEGVEAFVLGCTGMLGVAEAVEVNLARAGYTVPVIESGRAAVMMGELMGNLGYRHSRRAYPKENGI